MFNRFDDVPKNKLGFNSTFTIPLSMAEALDSAIPIWVLLGMTAEEYYEKHPLQKPVQNKVEEEEKEQKLEIEEETQFPVEQKEEEKKE